jgi:hypothetical protein
MSEIDKQEELIGVGDLESRGRNFVHEGMSGEEYQHHAEQYHIKIKSRAEQATPCEKDEHDVI